MSDASELAHLFRALKAPAAASALPKLAERARAEDWSYERFASALLATEVSARATRTAARRASNQARFPARKTLEEFDFSFQRSVKKTLIQHLGQLDFLHAKDSIVLLGPPGTGKTHLAIALAIRACLAGHRVALRHRHPMGRPARRRPTRRTPRRRARRAGSAIPLLSSTRSATSRSTPRPRT